MRLSLAAASLALLVVVGCGRASGGVTPIVSPPASALVLWQGFPAGEHPRPIVWIGNASPNGFTTDGGKIAAMCNRFALGGSLPKNLPPRAVATWTDGSTFAYAGISAAQALSAMSRATPGMPASDCASVNPLVISGARLGIFDFDTDRGKAQMTAWLFTATGMSGEFAYPAVKPAAFWNGGMISGISGHGTTLEAGGRSLTYRFWGASADSGPCGASYKGVLLESSSAVAIALQMIPNSAPGAPVACDAMARERSINVALASPLGGRVVVDAAGDVVPVCQGTLSEGC